MTVFNAYMKITKRNAALILLYIGIFVAVTVMIQADAKETAGVGYRAESVKIGIVDGDKGTFSKGLIEYLDQFHEITLMEDDKRILQENLFYDNVSYIVKVPAGFEERSLSGDEKLSVTMKPGSYAGFYVDQQINSFMNNVRTYHAAGYAAKEAIEAVLDTEKPTITMLDRNGYAGEMPQHTNYFRYVPYLLICVICYVLGNILSSFKKPDIQKRMRASAVPERRQNLEALLAAGVFSVALWLFVILGAVVLYKDEFLQSKVMFYYIMNSFMVLLVTLAIAYLIGMIATDINALSGIVNTIALGMCFLCGVFVPMDVMSKGVKTAAQFLPIYWYEKVNDTLASAGTITGDVKIEILKEMGIQLVFAAAILCVAMVISRKKALNA